MKLKDIEQLVKKFADAHSDYNAVRRQLKHTLQSAIRKAYALLDNLGSRVAEHQANLHAAIEGNPKLFRAPRTFSFFGIEVGLRKKVGRLEWDDADAVVEKIREHFPDAGLLRVKHCPDRDALEALPAHDLKKLGIRVSADTDQVVIKPAKSEVDRWLDAVLIEAVKEEQP